MNPTTRPKPKASTILAVIVAAIATGNAYLAMVQFAIDTIGMNPGTAYATAGVFELSLFTVAVLAREAAKDNRPNGVLLTLTWMLSAASGLFAAWHEHTLGHDIGAVLFRISVPVLAALMWHLALIGERHLATGTSWADARRNRRMQAVYERSEDRFRIGPDGARGRRAAARHRRALHRARRVTPPALMINQTAQWDAASAAETATIVTARQNHARQMAAFENRTAEPITATPAAPVAPTPPQAPTPAPVTAPAPVASIRPATAPTPVAVVAQTTSTPTTGKIRDCAVCGKPLTKPGAKYCRNKRADGTLDQTCKNKYNGPKFAEIRERVNLELAIEKRAARANQVSATVGPLAHHGPVFA